MKNRLVAAGAGLLLISPFALGAQPPAQPGSGPGPGPGAGRGGGGHMMGQGMGACGMMGGWGGGMMGPGWGAVDLDKAQRDKIQAIHRELRGKQFALMDRMHDSMHSTNVYRNGKFDEQVARNAYVMAEKIHRQMFENMLDAQKRVDALLTPQQRQQLSQAGE